MKKNTLQVVLLAVLILGVLLFLSGFWYRFSSFYKDCEKIKPGMTQEEIEVILNKYLTDNNYYIAREGALWGPGLYISSKSSGNSCNIAIKEGKVEQTESHFE